MKTYKILQNSLAIIAILLSSFAFGQAQTEYINYQGVARDASNEIIANESIQIGVALRFGLPTSAVLYSENHTVTTDISGVFSLQIGTGIVNSGIYKNLEWGKLASHATITLNGTDVGTVALQSVPYANRSGKAVNMQLNELINVEGTPTSGQVLKFDGTNWTPDIDDIGTGGSAIWTKTGDDILYDAGTVSIGENFDYAKLNVNISNTDTAEDSHNTISIQNAYSGDDAVFGMINNVNGIGNGLKTGFRASILNGEGPKYGFTSSIKHNGGGLTSTASGFTSVIVNNSNFESSGFRSSTSGTGLGTNYGIYTSGEDKNYFSGNVGIGSNDLTGKVTVMNTTNEYGLNIKQDYSGISSYGVYNIVSGTGTRSTDKYGYFGSVEDGDGKKTGIRSQVLQEANTTAMGLDIIVNSKGSGNIYGIYNDLIHSGSGNIYGYFANFYDIGSGDKYGLYIIDEDKNYLSGKLGINTVDPRGRLHIKDGYSFGERPFIELETNFGDRSDIRFSKTDQKDYWEIISGLRTDPSSATLSFYYIDGNPSTEDQILTLRGDGIIQYTGSLSDVSDRRLKENILKIESPLSKVLALNGYSYNMINDANKKMEYGVMAQEVQEVLPYAVNVMDDEKGYLGVSYLQLIPVLIEAIKEQQKEIETLKSDYLVLISKIDRIETQLSSRATNSNSHTDSKP